MAFLYPVFLWTLAGLSAPLLIHLFGKKKGRQIRFGSLMFLKSSAAKAGRVRRIEETVILSLRTLFLAFLFLFLAGPLSRSFLRFKETTSVVFLVDDSFSMAAKDGSIPFEDAKTCMRKILSSLKRPSSKAGMVFLSGPCISFTGDFQELESIIDKSRVSCCSGNLQSAMGRVNDMCRSLRENVNVYFFTDMQKNAWLDFSPAGLNKNLKFTVVDTGKPGDENLSIKSLSRIPGKNAFSCEIVNWGRKDSVTGVVLYSDRNEITKTVSVPGKSSLRVLFETPPGVSAVSAKITCNDLIPGDNQFFLSLFQARNRKILIAGDDPQSMVYVKSSLEADTDPECDVRAISTESLETAGHG